MLSPASRTQPSLGNALPTPTRPRACPSGRSRAGSCFQDSRTAMQGAAERRVFAPDPLRSRRCFLIRVSGKRRCPPAFGPTHETCSACVAKKASRSSRFAPMIDIERATTRSRARSAIRDSTSLGDELQMVGVVLECGDSLAERAIAQRQPADAKPGEPKRFRHHAETQRTRRERRRGRERGRRARGNDRLRPRRARSRGARRERRVARAGRSISAHPWDCAAN